MSCNVRSLMIGLGTHAQRGHADHFPSSGIDLVAAVDTSPEAVALFRERYPGLDCDYAADPAAFLTRSDIEAVFIMTPDRFHIDQARQALASGKHVFCEKPMTNSTGSLSILEACLDTASERKLILTSCHPRRFDRPFLWLRSRLHELTAALGPVLEFRFDFSYAKLSKEGLHHGLMIDHFNHEIDLLHFLFGYSPFEAHRLFDSDIRYQVSGVRSDGMTFTFGGTRMLDGPKYPEYSVIRFERGEVRLDTGSGRAAVSSHETGHQTVEECGTTDYDGRFRAVNRNFADAVRGTSVNYLTPGDLWVNTESSVLLTECGTYRSGEAGFRPSPSAAV